MTYTFWHQGTLAGEAELSSVGGNRRQLGGVFHPTPHGLRMMPQLCGIIRIGTALRAHLQGRGKSLERMLPDEAESVLSDCEEGRALIDFGRTVSEIEVRRDDGTPVNVESMGFSDLVELERMAGKPAAPPKSPPGGKVPRYLVSVSVKNGTVTGSVIRS